MGVGRGTAGHRARCPVRGQWERPLAELTAQPSRDPAQLYTRTKGKDPPGPPPPLESLPTELSRVLLGLGSIRELLGWGTISSLCHFILTQSDSGSKLPSSGKLTRGLSL